MEICIDNLESAKNAIDGGATRLEVCSALSEGGLTPSAGFVKLIRDISNVPISIMLRIRCGDFVYSKEEMEAMLYDLEIFKNLGASGFVFGALTPDNKVDVAACKKILSAAEPLPVTFHRAFDEVTDPCESLELLIDLGFRRVLTSGQCNTAEEGLDLLRRLVEQANDRIIVMPGSGITKDNIRTIKAKSGAKEFHGSAKVKKMPSGCSQTIRLGSGSCDISVTDCETVKKMVEIVKSRVH